MPASEGKPRKPLPPRRRALRTRANFPQIEPGINSQIVFIVPRKSQSVLPHRLRRHRSHRRFEHRQSPRRQLRSLARFAPRLRPLILAKRARTSIPQERKRVHRPVSVLPLNLHPPPSRQMNHHRLGIVPHPRREIRQRHNFQYRTCQARVVTGLCPVRTRGHTIVSVGTTDSMQLKVPTKN